MDRKDNPNQGFAVYLEVGKPLFTKQAFLMPEGYDSFGNLVPSRYFYREMVVGFKKAMWHSANLNSDATPDSSKDTETYFKLAHLLHYLPIEESGYSLIGSPLVVEVSKLDYDDIRSGKTPTKLIYRINQSRTSAGFPVEIVN
jgi:hypothetical protein